MTLMAILSQGVVGLLLILSSLGVILAKKPVHACLSFLLSLLMFSALYLHLSANFLAILQILVYAGAILVIFMFVIVLFQDIHQQIRRFVAGSSRWWLALSGLAFSLALVFVGMHFLGLSPAKELEGDFGTVHSLGRGVFVAFFFPFEAVVLVFLTAIVGALYLGKKES